MSRTFGGLFFDAAEIHGALLPNHWAPAYVIAQYDLHQLERYNELVKRLNEIAQLADNWDGYGGAAIGPSAVDHARRLLGAHLRYSATLSFPEILPTSNGTVAFEWQDGEAEAVVEIGESRLSGFVRGPSAEPVLLGGSGDELSEQIPTLIDAYLASDTSQGSAISTVEYELADK